MSPKYIKKAQPPGPGGAPPAAEPGMAGPPPGPAAHPTPELPDADPNAEPTLLPRHPGEDPVGGPVPPGPGLGMPGPMGQVPTDVHIDAQTGEVSIKKGPVNISVAMHKQAPYDSKSELPDAAKNLPSHAQEIFRKAFNNAKGQYDDEEKAFATAWSAVKSKYKKDGDTWKKKESMVLCPECLNKTAKKKKCPRCDGEGMVEDTEASKTAGHDIPSRKPWAEFNHGNPPDVTEGEPGREDYFKDTWETPYAAPANRRKPPVYDVVARVPDGGNARGLAYAVQLYTTLATEVDGNKVTIKGSENPVALINELKSQGIDASTSGLLEDYPKAGEAAREYMGYQPGIYSPGVKVAIVGDFPEMSYQYNPDYPPVEAQIIAKRGDEYLVRNDIWGTFVVEPHEIRGVNYV